MAKFITGLVFLISFFSCETEMSVSKFIAMNETKPGFKSFTIPSDALVLREGMNDPQVKDAVESLQTINVLMYSGEERPPSEMEALIEDAMTIVRSERYETMMEVVNSERSFYLKTRKENDEVKEILVFGKGKDSFFLGRILGDLNEGQGIHLANAIDFSKLIEFADIKGIEVN